MTNYPFPQQKWANPDKFSEKTHSERMKSPTNLFQGSLTSRILNE